MKATHHSHIWLNLLLLASLLLTLTPIEALRASAPEAQLTPLRLPQVVKTWATPQTPVQDPPPGWLDRITKDVARAEYQVTWQDTTPLAGARAAYQAPNRAQNLRAYFTPDSLHLVPRTTTGPAWMLNLAVTGYGATGATQRVAGAKLEAAGNGVQYERGDLIEWYVNHAGGLEQGFTLLRGPSGDGARTVIEMVYDGDLQAHLVEEGAAVEFTAAGVRVLRYGEVHAYDATGAALPAYLELEKAHIRLVVEAANAVYPLTIDPLFTTPDWAVEGPQTVAGFGAAVSAVGDVNGDGYSDIVIGAPDFDGGETDEGKVFVYYGSATGPSATAGWTAEGNQAGARLGAGVSLAGDVNGDGYGDLIVSAPDYDDAQVDVGAVYVYYGDGDGLSATPDWMASGDQAGARFGGAVRLAGDVNGDGYSDVIIGAPDYDAGATDTGKVYVYHGSANGLSSMPEWTAAGDQAGAYFGAAVAGAGDVNSDGYADVIVGAPYYDNGETDEGRVFVYHGSSVGLSANANWTAESNQAGASFGAAAAPAGDVNGDGYADVIVGAPAYDNGQTDEGRAFVYHGAAAGLGATAAWTAESNQAGARLGAAVGPAGDVNGDGYADVVVGIPEYDGGQTDEGRICIYTGSASGSSSACAWSLESDQAGARLGAAVGVAGDVDGDGWSDVIAGAPGYDGAQSDVGRAYVMRGGAMDVAASPGWTLEANQAYAHLGYFVATTGDIDGDGYADVVVGAPDYDNGQSNEGRAYVFLGAATGLNTTPHQVLEINQANAHFGVAVGTAGDVNGDGYSDIIIGADGYSNGQTAEGAAFVYYGSAGGLNPTPAWQVESNQANSKFGYWASAAGDVNGDGYADVIVGAYTYDNGQTDEGAAFVYHGSAAGLSTTPNWMAEGNQANAQYGVAVNGAGDVNGDGYSDVLVGAYFYDGTYSNEGRAELFLGSAEGLSSTPAWTVVGGQTNAYLGDAVAGAGDVNGDGYADVVIGAYGYDNGQIDEGRAYIYYGSAGGLSTTPDWVNESNATGANYGTAVGTAGDVNGDGYADVIIGAKFESHGQLSEGRAYLYLGGPTGLATTASWTAESNQALANLGGSVGTAGDVNGDGYADVIVGAGWYESGWLQMDEGYAALYYGNGGSGGLGARPRQRRLDDTAPIAPGGRSDGAGVQIALTGRTPLGRATARLQWQVAPLGTPFTATTGVFEGISPGWTALWATGTAVTQSVTGLASDAGYHWRVRWLYAPDNVLGQPAGRWLHAPWNGWLETDFRTAVVVETPITGLAATNDSPTALGQATTLTATVSAGSNVNYTWAFGDGATGSGAVAAYTYPDVGLYTAVVTASNSANTVTATTTVTVGDVAITGLAATNDSPTALGQATTLTATVSAGSNVNYTWAFGDGATGSGAVAAHTYPDVGLYTAVVTASNSANTVTATTTVTVGDVAITGLAATNDSPTALGQATTLTATVGAGSNVVYTWAFGDGTTGSGAVAAHTYPDVGLYTAVVTASNSANTVTATTTVTVGDVLITGLAAVNDSPTALGQATTLTATVSAGSNVVYTWAFGDGSAPFTTSGATGSGVVAAHTYPDVGLYTAVVTASNNANTVTATTTVTVSDVAITGLAAMNDSPTALGQATTLTATVSAGSNVVYTWAFGDGSAPFTTSGATGSGAVAVHTYPDVGLYTAVVTASNSANTITATTTVTVGDVAITGLAAVNDSPTTLGQATTLTATVSAGSNVNYTWAFGDGETGVGATVNHTYPDVGLYSAVVTASNSTNSVTATTQVSVTAGGDEAIAGLTATNDSPTWLGQATALWAAVSAGENVNYTWAFGDGSMGNGPAVAHTYANAGTYLAVVTATNSVNTLTAATPVTVVAAAPVADFVGTPLGGYVPLTVTFSNHSTNAASYVWDFGDGSTAVVENPTHTYTRTGVFTVSLTAHGPGGSASRVKADYVTVVALNAAPVVVITGPAEGAVVGSAEVVVSGEVADDGSVTQVWVNDVPAVLDGDAFSAILTLAGGNQTIVAVAQDDAGAYGTASRVVQVDVSGPMVAIQTPPDGQAIYTLSPMVTVAYNDYYASIDTGSFAAWIEDASGVLTDVMDGFSISSDYAYGTLPTLAEDTVYTLTVSIADEFGHTGSDRNTFYVPAGAGDIEPPWVEGVAGWVSGHVYDAATCDVYLTTCAGLAGAHITLATLDNVTRVVTEDVAGTLVSGPSGFYAFPIAETGVYALRIEKAGYTYGQREAAVVRGRSTAVNALYLTAITDTASIVTGPLTQTFVHTSTNGGATIVVEIPPEALAAGQTVTVTATNFPHVEFLPSGALPPGTMETYAFNLGGASEITFTQPITVRMENYRGFAPGTVIPLGYWNQRTLQWEHVGRGTVDASGEWLVMHTAHFSNFDVNFPAPPFPDIEWDGAQGSDGDGCSGDECPAGESGSFIEYKSGRVQEWIDLPGVNVLGQTVAPGLAYDTRRADPTALIDVQLDLNFDPNITTLGDYVQFELFIEGQKTARYTFDAAPDGNGEVGRYRYLWDGRNAVGDMLPPGVYAYAAKLSVPYTRQYYWSTNNVFGGPSDLSRPTGVTVTATRDYWVRGNVALNTQIDSPFGRGWTLEGYQALYADEAGRILITDGSQQTHYYAATRDRLAGVAQYNVPEPFVAGPAAEFSLPQFPETGTLVSGTLTADTTWTLDNSPYVLTGNVLVPAGVTLTIQPGVTVLLDQDQRMIVDGGLQAVGSASTPITFTAYTSGTQTHSKTYQYTPHDREYSHYISEEEVQTFTVDEDGNVWVGGYVYYGHFEGQYYEVFLFRLDRTGTWDDDYHSFNVDLNEPEVRAVTVDAAGQVWIAWTATSEITGGIRVLGGLNWSFYDDEDLLDTDIRALELDTASGDMWVGTALGANQFVSATQTWVSHTVVSDVQALASDDAGNVWFGTGAGLWQRTISDTWSSYNTNDNIVDVALDGDGNVWMAVANAGLRVYLTGGEWLTYTTANSDMLTDTVTGLAVDGQGRVWVGYGAAAAGASVLSADRLVWSHVSPDETGMEAVNVAVQSAAGDVWLGGAGAWGASSALYHAYSSAAPNTTNGGHWGYLKLNSDAARLQYVVLEAGGSRRSPMLYMDAAAPVLENLTIRGSGGPGLLAVDALSLTLYNVQTTSNASDGIQLRGGDHYRIISATTQYNQRHGLRLEDAGHVVVTGTTLARNARGYGVWSADNATSLVFQDNAVSGNAYAARLPLAHHADGNVWTGNRVNRIDIAGGELDADSVWETGLPYRVTGNVTVGANAPATLTLPPGARLLFVEYAGLYVRQNGTLWAMGTSTAPITLERADPDAQWLGVDVNASIPRLSYVTIRGANLGLALALPHDEDVAVDHLTLAGNNYGLYVETGGWGGSFTVRESNFVANRDVGLGVGVLYYGVVTATHNYWNSPTGPYNAAFNPLGTGDSIIGTGVTQETFTPYLRRPSYLGSLAYDVVNLTPVDHTVLDFVEHNGVYTYTRAYPDGRQVVFDTEGRHLYTREADGRAVVYTYNDEGEGSDQGLLATMGIVTPGGNLDAPTWVWSFAYSYAYSGDKLAHISYNDDTVAAFTVNAQGNLEQVTFPDESTRRFYYDERGLLTQQVDPLGQVTGYGYDQYGRLAQSIAPATTVYTPATGETAMRQTVRTFTPGDSQGLINPYPAPGTPAAPSSAAPTSTLLVDSVTYADGSTRGGHTNAWGQWTDQTDALGRTTVYTRDANNNLTGLVQPEGDCIVATYDAAGRPTYAARMGAEQCALPPEQRDPAQMQSTAFTYEARFGQVKTQTDALGQTTVYTYDYELDLGDAGKLVQIAYPRVQDEAGVWRTPVVSYTYNALGLLAEETARDGTLTQYTYTTGYEEECPWEEAPTLPCFAPGVTPVPGLRAQVVRISGDTVLTTTYTSFDARGRAQTTVAPDGNVTHTSYDVMGRVISTTSAVGVTTLRTYDAAGRLVTTTVQRPDDPAAVTEYLYDAAGRQIATRTSAGAHVAESHTYYDVGGRRVAVADALGRITRYVYDAAGQLLYTVDPLGQPSGATAYDLNGRQTWITDTLSTSSGQAAGTVSYNEYDALGQLARSVRNWEDGVFDPAAPDRDLETRYQYDQMGRTIIVTDTVGAMTRTWYDDAGRTLGSIAHWDGSATLADCATLPATRAANLCTQYAYDAVGRTVIITDTVGRMARTFYDAAGRVTARVENWNPATLSSPDQCVLSAANTATENICTRYGYDPLGRQITTTNALGQTSLTVYDAYGRAFLSVANWDGAPIADASDCAFPPAQPDANLCTVTEYDYDRRSATVDALGRRTEFGYDALGRVVTTTRYLGTLPVTTLTHYDLLGQRVGQTDARGNTATFIYDALGRQVETVTPEGLITRQYYDVAGRVEKMQDAGGKITAYEYDALGRRIAVIDPLSQTTRFAYSALGNQTAITDANGIVTAYAYDALNRLSAVTENQRIGESANHETNVVTQYAYDVLGYRTVITNARAYTQSFTTYDILGRPVIVEDALGNQTFTAYDALGRRTVVTDADGLVTHYFYDGLNRLVEIQYPDATVEYAYDALGRRTAMTDTSGVTTYEYDNLGRVIRVTDPFTGVVEYGYDLAGNRTAMTVTTAGGIPHATHYTYDGDNRLIQVTDWATGTTNYAYDFAGRLSTTTLPNNVVTTHSYDAAGRLTGLTHTHNGVLLTRYAYTLDATGNRTRVAETVSGVTREISYTYDALYRLTAADYSTGEAYAYQYDSVGNREVMTVTSNQQPVTSFYAYDPANRLTSIQLPDSSIQAYTWDNRGNLLADGTFTYTYSAAGRMVRAESLTATLVYTYNADGLRVAQSQSVSSVQSVDTFTWDWATPVPELLSDGESLYLIGYDTLGWQNGDGWTFVLPDALGSVRQETDATGAVTAVREWSPYGEEVGTAQTGLGYTGEWFDTGVGLTYLRARWYNGTTGGFTQVDVFDLNRPYMYALNNPINWRDPTGYFADETIKNSLKPQTEIDWNSPDLFVTPEWGALENPLLYNVRPKFSGLLALLKEAKSGDRIRSGRLVQRGWNLEIDWTISRPLKLSRCEDIKVGWLSLDGYIENLRNTSYWLGGYVYHELSSDGEVTIYRDGASLVPDVLMRDLSSPGVNILGVKVGAVWRTSVDRYGNEYESEIVPISSGGSIGVSLLPSVGWYAVYLGAEYLSYPDFAEYAVNRGIPDPDVIEKKWRGAGQPSFAFGSTITAVAGDLGVGIGGLGSDMTFTMFMKNYLKWSIGLSGLTTSYTTLKGNTYPGWNTLDADTIGVTWADALSTPGK